MLGSAFDMVQMLFAARQVRETILMHMHTKLAPIELDRSVLQESSNHSIQVSMDAVSN